MPGNVVNVRFTDAKARLLPYSFRLYKWNSLEGIRPAFGNHADSFQMPDIRIKNFPDLLLGFVQFGFCLPIGALYLDCLDIGVDTLFVSSGQFFQPSDVLGQVCRKRTAPEKESPNILILSSKPKRVVDVLRRRIFRNFAERIYAALAKLQEPFDNGILQ